MEAALCAHSQRRARVGGLAESIVDGETGLLAATPASWPQRVRELVRDPELRESFGEAAERRARGFTWDRSARAFLEVLRRAAGRAPADARRRSA